MSDAVITNEQLRRLAAELTGHGLHVEIPAGKAAPGTSCIGVRDPGTGQYAEIFLVTYGSGPGEVFLQLSYWTTATYDPDGLQMASQVRCMLAG